MPSKIDADEKILLFRDLASIPCRSLALTAIKARTIDLAAMECEKIEFKEVLGKRIQTVYSFSVSAISKA